MAKREGAPNCSSDADIQVKVWGDTGCLGFLTQVGFFMVPNWSHFMVSRTSGRCGAIQSARPGNYSLVNGRWCTSAIPGPRPPGNGTRCRCDNSLPANCSSPARPRPLLCDTETEALALWPEGRSFQLCSRISMAVARSIAESNLSSTIS
jgi:hypothetical protein